MDAAKTHKQVLTVNGKNLRITVPAGIADGQTIQLKGQGGEGAHGGPAGDLYITFVLAEDSVFKRAGDDLYVTVPLNLYTAILGGEQIVNTMDGKVKLKIEPGTQNNTKVRLKGKGFPVYKKDGQFGDLIVSYAIDIPTNLSDKQKELFREIQNLA
jgi:curved DNA-binding protein